MLVWFKMHIKWKWLLEEGVITKHRSLFLFTCVVVLESEEPWDNSYFFDKSPQPIPGSCILWSADLHHPSSNNLWGDEDDERKRQENSLLILKARNERKRLWWTKKDAIKCSRRWDELHYSLFRTDANKGDLKEASKGTWPNFMT